MNFSAGAIHPLRRERRLRLPCELINELLAFVKFCDDNAVIGREKYRLTQSKFSELAAFISKGHKYLTLLNPTKAATAKRQLQQRQTYYNFASLGQKQPHFPLPHFLFFNFVFFKRLACPTAISPSAERMMLTSSLMFKLFSGSKRARLRKLRVIFYKKIV